MAIRGLSDQAIRNLEGYFYLLIYGLRSPGIAERGWLMAPKNGPHFWYLHTHGSTTRMGRNRDLLRVHSPCRDRQRHQRCQGRWRGVISLGSSSDGNASAQSLRQRQDRAEP
jgi:hypothetical protein